MTKKMIVLKELLEMIPMPVSYSTIYRWMENGEFPQANKIGSRNVWWRKDVEKWIEDNCSEQEIPQAGF